MSKELFVSSTPHETKVAVVEEDQLAEIYFERENEYTLAGSIYKGKVTRVLPGMQSAFVDIGLERDAFLYVSDFFEAEEDSDLDTSPAEGDGNHRRDSRSQRQAHAPEAAIQTAPPEEDIELAESEEEPAEESIEAEAPAETAGEAQSPEASREDRGRRFGRRRRGRRGRGFPESKFAGRGPERPAALPPPPPPAPHRSERSFAPPAAYQPIILPGESISKYRNRQPVATATPEPAAAAAPLNSELAGAAEFAPPEVPASVEEMRASHEAEKIQPENGGEFTQQPRRPTEEIDVASILHQRHQQAEHARHEPISESIETAGRFGSAGVVEEEEIDEEETESPHLAGAYEEDEYDDFEEEMLDRVDAMEHRDVESSNVAESAPLSEPSPPPAEGNGEGQPAPLVLGDADFDEAETQAAEAAETEEGSEVAEETPDRAEVRGPSGQQQRVAFDRDRAHRGRRGGRRGRTSFPRGRRFNRGPLPQISDLLKEGQEILVQIAKEPIGKKGARITSHIALPGRFLVYMPTVNHNGVSRKIASDEERQRLKRIIASERQASTDSNGGGFIVRTAAASAGEEDLRADIRFLLNLWSEIRQRADASKGGTLIYHDLNLVERILRDQVSEGFSHIWVDSEPEYERILRFVNRFQSSLVKRVKLYTKETPLFEQFSIQDEINKALKSKVWLKSGGYIVINQTEALVAIDVNTGKYVGKTQKLEDTIVKTNVDAIKEIVRQIRLRDLGGIIVIDFIDMDERRNRQKVMQALEEALKGDRAPSKVLQFNDFGLVAITRKRVKQSLERTLGAPCTYCSGTGLIKSVATVCNELYVEMRKMAHHLERGDIIVRVNPEVGKALKANNARWLQDMEDLTGKTVIVKPDPTLHQEQFDIH